MTWKTKGIIAIVVMSLAGVLGLWAYAAMRTSNSWERISTIGEEKAELVQQFNIPASGWNLRGYEFGLPSNPNIHCVFVAGSNKGGVDCFNVE